MADSNDGNNINGGPAKSDKRPKVKPISRITSSPLTRLRTARCFPEIDRRIRLGWSTGDVARMVQEEYKELTDLSFKYLKKTIDKYRLSLPPTELGMSSNSLVVQNATKKMANGLDELAQMEYLFNLQMERINIDVANEKTIKKLFPTTGKEVFVALKILNQSVQLKMDLGLLKRQLGSMEVTGQLAAEAGERYGNNSVGKVIADPDSRKKVLSLAERLIKLGAQAGMDAVAVMDSLPKPVEETYKDSAIDVPSTVTLEDEVKDNQ